MILQNCNVITMDERMPRASALAIAGGKVLGGVDSREDAIASHAHEQVDLKGRTVVPGFVDSHVHFRRWALGRTQLDLRDCHTVEDLLAAVASAKPDETGVIRGQGWRDELVRDLEDPAHALTEATGGRQAALISKDGHALWLAMEQHRGVVRETESWEIRRQLALDEPSTADMAKAMREAARRGITCVHDMDGSDGLKSWRRLERERGLSIRVCQFLLQRDFSAAVRMGLDEGFGSDRLWIGGLKLFADGTLGSQTAWLLPSRGVQLTTKEKISACLHHGLPVAVHAIGDGATYTATEALRWDEPQFVDMSWELDEPQRRPLGERRFSRIEHAQLMRPEDILTCASQGVTLSIQPTHLINDRDLVDEHWGDRADNAFAWRRMADAGVPILLGSDAPIEDLNPLAAIYAAVHRDGGAHGLGPARGPWRPEQALTPEEALRATCTTPHDVSAPGRGLGRLTPGKQADLVVLSGDPLVEPLGDIEVVATMVGGRWTYGAANLG